MLKHFCYHHPDSFLQLMCRNDQQVKEFDLWKETFLDSDEPPLTTFLKKDVLQEHIYHEFHYMPIQRDVCAYFTTNKVHLKEHLISSHGGKFLKFNTCKNDDFESWVTKFVS
ncbi:hypothetical protein MRX96_015212 [Rhipicephalus microplus]